MQLPGENLVIKLWETVAEKGIGSLFKPWQMRREGRATIDLKREELLTIAQAEQDADRIRRGEMSLVTNSSSTLLLTSEATLNTTDAPAWHSQLPIATSNILIADTLRRETNVVRALLHAEEALEGDQADPPEAKVNDDWLFRWRDGASQVTSDELQNLWGRLLAGEIKTPGMYSLRTLEFLRNLSQREAKDIAKLSQFVIENVIYKEGMAMLEKAGIDFRFLMGMQQLGIVSGIEAFGISIVWKSTENTRFIKVIRSNSMVLFITATDPNLTVSLPTYQITEVGMQVLKLGKFEANVEYLKAAGEHIKKQGFEVQLAQYIDTSPGKITFFQPQKL